MASTTWDRAGVGSPHRHRSSAKAQVFRTQWQRAIDQPIGTVSRARHWYPWACSLVVFRRRRVLLNAHACSERPARQWPQPQHRCRHHDMRAQHCATVRTSSLHHSRLPWSHGTAQSARVVILWIFIKNGRPWRAISASTPDRAGPDQGRMGLLIDLWAFLEW